MTPTQGLTTTLTEANIPFTVENDIIEIPRLGFESLFVEYRQRAEDFIVRTDGPEEDDYFGTAFDYPEELIETVFAYMEKYPHWVPAWPLLVGTYWYLREGDEKPEAHLLAFDGGSVMSGVRTGLAQEDAKGLFLPITLPDTTLLEEHLKKLREGM